MEFKKIPLEQIHVRHPMHIKKTPQGYREHVESLVDSIAVLGLIQPIAVYQDSEQEYFVIDGAKRLQACQWFNQKFPEKELAAVECVIHTNIEDEFEKEKIIHTSMYLGTTPSISDSIDSLRYFWNMYGNFKIIKMKYGISKNVLEKYVRETRLSSSVRLKEAISSGEIAADPDKALDAICDAISALNWTADNDVSEDYVLKFAVQIAKPRKRYDSF
jgi:hypothetical protein